KLDETSQVIGEENVSGKVEKVKEVDIYDKPVSKRSIQQEPNKNDIDKFDDAIEKQNFRLASTLRKIIPFYNVDKYNKVFVNGVKLTWLLKANNNFLRLHPISADDENGDPINDIEQDNLQTNIKYKLLCHEEVKRFVTAICDVKGYLLACVRPK
ncbi:700_t:CDS:2, partial [Funneliformis geosporum]